ncbi:OmpA family protein [Filobacillus milosensis]|uniref:OmpA family protein n=1 Tax=Filobacillus milosensis TaxID=94137 RepID=A0A4Y8IC82_9BACI|nr:OmpA family protein [Filobacillus milosensis]TFB13570.1 OmpA family protein [Filobacillus milosensis]
MARKRLERSREYKHVEEEGNHYWMSYSDLMSALLFVFALLLMVNMFSNQKEIEAKNEVIEDIIGIKSEIIKELSATFKGSDVEMIIDPQTGAITLSSGVLFEYSSSKISEEGKENLAKFIPLYMEVLLSEQFKPHISQIIIEGHTDNQGSYLYNLELSHNRSLAVVQEILSEDFPMEDQDGHLRDVLTSNGRSYSDPILDNGEVDQDASRRVEFKFRLKDEEMFEEIQELVANNES